MITKKFWGLTIEEVQSDGRLFWIVQDLGRSFPVGGDTDNWAYGLNIKLLKSAIKIGVERIIDREGRFNVENPTRKMLKYKDKHGEYVDLPSKYGGEDMRIYLFKPKK